MIIQLLFSLNVGFLVWCLFGLIGQMAAALVQRYTLHYGKLLFVVCLLVVTLVFQWLYFIRTV